MEKYKSVELQIIKLMVYSSFLMPSCIIFSQPHTGAKGSNTATPEAPETTSIADKNINIEAKGVDVKLEITGDSYNISISAPEGQESQIQPVNEVSTVNASESTTEPQRSPNWIEYITVILLAVLVGLEIKDKLHKEKQQKIRRGLVLLLQLFLQHINY